jgi:hypothetical protein
MSPELSLILAYLRKRSKPVRTIDVVQWIEGGDCGKKEDFTDKVIFEQRLKRINQPYKYLDRAFQAIPEHSIQKP